jgi:hypothetical protein
MLRRRRLMMRAPMKQVGPTTRKYAIPNKPPGQKPNNELMGA